MLKFDYRQFQCPHPVVETRKQILANPGRSILVQVGDPTARENVSRLAVSQGYSVETETVGDSFTLTLTPGSGNQTAMPVINTTSGKTVIFCNSDRMGEGDEELGRILLKNFFMTLTELERSPETILFVNAGVRLVCRGSEIIEALDKLACRGVDIAACGLCLDFYHLKDQLQVGRVTNMLEIAESQLQAGRLITP